MDSRIRDRVCEGAGWPCEIEPDMFRNKFLLPLPRVWVNCFFGVVAIGVCLGPYKIVWAKHLGWGLAWCVQTE
jgi:hypothetical protein